MFSSSSSSTFSISMLAILLLLVQTAILSFGDLIGMRYQKWIQHMFLDPQTSCFKATVNTKKSMDLLVSSLEAMIPGENPSVLQLDHSLRQYPSSLQIPLQLLQYGQQPDQRIYSNSTLTTAGNPSSHHVEDEISRILEEYEKTRLIPKSLWEDTIFRPRWFRATFIPAITLLPERLDVRDALMAALMDKKRINEDTYAEYLEKRTV
ncbi:hypothetical protein BX666DRAFT_1876894 [Dichotomocladium elegans]|nr:hypothetical protein BX666DRAFT_1876894 [Dichotomocladium elegans]